MSDLHHKIVEDLNELEEAVKSGYIPKVSEYVTFSEIKKVFSTDNYKTDTKQEAKNLASGCKLGIMDLSSMIVSKNAGDKKNYLSYMDAVKSRIDNLAKFSFVK